MSIPVDLAILVPSVWYRAALQKRGRESGREREGERERERERGREKGKEKEEGESF